MAKPEAKAGVISKDQLYYELMEKTEQKKQAPPSKGGDPDGVLDGLNDLDPPK